MLYTKNDFLYYIVDLLLSNVRNDENAKYTKEAEGNADENSIASR